MVATRREFLIGAMGAGALGLAACSSSGSGKSTAPSSAASVGTTKLSGSITVWDFLDEATSKSEDPLFTAAYPNITVKRVHQPAANFNQLLQAALSSRTAPDALILSAGGPITQFSSGLEKLDDRLTSDQKDNLAFGPVMSPELDIANGIYGLPLDDVGPIIFYNKKLFRQAGLDPDNPPTAWPEIEAAATALKGKGITPMAGGDKEGLEASTWFWILAPMIMKSQDTLDLANGKLEFNSDPVREVFQHYVDIAKNGWFQSSWRTDGIFAENADHFSTGKAGMCLLISSFIPIFAKSLGSDLGLIQAPGLTAGSKPNYLPYGGGLALSVTKQSRNKDAAYAWVSWRAGTAMQQRDLNTLSADAKTSASQQARLPTDKRIAPTGTAIPAVTDTVAAIKAATSTYPGAQQLWKTPVMTATLSNFGPVVAGQKSLTDALNALDDAQKTAK